MFNLNDTVKYIHRHDDVTGEVVDISGINDVNALVGVKWTKNTPDWWVKDLIQYYPLADIKLITERN